MSPLEGVALVVIAAFGLARAMPTGGQGVNAKSRQLWLFIALAAFAMGLYARWRWSSFDEARRAAELAAEQAGRESALAATATDRAAQAESLVRRAEQAFAQQDFERAASAAEEARNVVKPFRTLRGGMPSEMASAVGQVDRISAQGAATFELNDKTTHCLDRIDAAPHPRDDQILGLDEDLAACEVALEYADAAVRGLFGDDRAKSALARIQTKRKSFRKQADRARAALNRRYGDGIASDLASLAGGRAVGTVVSSENDYANRERVTKATLSGRSVELRRSLDDGSEWTLTVFGVSASDLGATQRCSGHMSRITSGPLAGAYLNAGNGTHVIMSRSEMVAQMHHEGGRGSVDEHFGCGR